MHKAFILLATACILIISGLFSQTVYKYSIDSRIFFKINDNELLNITVDKETRAAKLDNAAFHNDQSVTLDVQGMESGLYVISIENDGIKTIKKILLTN